MDALEKLQSEYLCGKGKEIPCLGEIASPSDCVISEQRSKQPVSVACSNGINIPPRASRIVRIKVKDIDNGKYVYVMPGSVFVDLLPVELLA